MYRNKQTGETISSAKSQSMYQRAFLEHQALKHTTEGFDLSRDDFMKNKGFEEVVRIGKLYKRQAQLINSVCPTAIVNLYTETYSVDNTFSKDRSIPSTHRFGRVLVPMLATRIEAHLLRSVAYYERERSNPLSLVEPGECAKRLVELSMDIEKLKQKPPRIVGWQYVDAYLYDVNPHWTNPNVPATTWQVKILSVLNTFRLKRTALEYVARQPSLLGWNKVIYSETEHPKIVPVERER